MLISRVSQSVLTSPVRSRVSQSVLTCDDTVNQAPVINFPVFNTDSSQQSLARFIVETDRRRSKNRLRDTRRRRAITTKNRRNRRTRVSYTYLTSW
jgi:hypothetical protein